MPTLDGVNACFSRSHRNISILGLQGRALGVNFDGGLDSLLLHKLSSMNHLVPRILKLDTPCLTTERHVPYRRSGTLQDDELSHCRVRKLSFVVVSVVYDRGESCLCDVKSRSFFVDGRQKASRKLHRDVIHLFFGIAVPSW